MRNILFSIVPLLISGTIQCQELKAKLYTESNKEEIFQNECIVTSVILRFDVDNEMAVKFTDELTSEILSIQKQLTLGDVIYHQINDIDIKAESRRINDQYYNVYKLYETGICPFTAKSVEIPAFKISLDKIDSSDQAYGRFEMTSEPISIKVHALPHEVKDSIYSNEFYNMVGDFTLTEKLRGNSEIHPLDTMDYTLTLRGKGVSEMVEWGSKEIKGMEIIPINSKSRDTIRFEDLRMVRKLDYKLVFHNPGLYDLSDIFQWRYYSTKENKVKSIQSAKQLTVVPNPSSQYDSALRTDQKTTNIVVAIDVSESMQIEDFNPSRLKAVTESLQEFFDRRDDDLQIILFAGETQLINKLQIPEVGNHQLEPGTAIGNAIWESIRILRRSTSEMKTLLIIGDGDNTAGFINLDIASELAREHGIQINSIGIGKHGSVPFGKDYFGRTRYVENTYNESALRQIAESTGGKFYRFMDKESFTIRLEKLFLKYSTVD